MLSLLSSGGLALWLDAAGWLPSLERSLAQSRSPLLDAPGLTLLADPDADARSILQRYLQQLNGQGMTADRQGIWLQTGAVTLADHRGTVPRSAASVTKVATSLVALHAWGSDRQFVTEIGATGALDNGVLDGDLVVMGGGDPLLVWEEAIAIAAALEARGIRRVTGNLILANAPQLVFNFKDDPAAIGNGLRQAFDARRWDDTTNKAYAQLSDRPPKPQIEIEGDVLATRSPDVSYLPLLRHRSLPLVSILKLMNVHSNNVVADRLAERLGGGAVVADRAARLAGVPSAEIQLVNGSGLGQDNRISPRAACALFAALQRHLSGDGLNVADVLPVFGRDGGTLKARTMPKGATVKTGTLWNVSALAGAIPTRDRGLVWFAILNGGDAHTLPFRRQQDELLAQLQDAWGVPTALPNPLQPSFPDPVFGAAHRTASGGIEDVREGG